jgi:hypothetical protein
MKSRYSLFLSLFSFLYIITLVWISIESIKLNIIQGITELLTIPVVLVVLLLTVYNFIQIFKNIKYEKYKFLLSFLINITTIVIMFKYD